MNRITKVILILIIIACILLSNIEFARADYVMPLIYTTYEDEHYTEEEKEIIAKVVYAEARGECFEGQVAVAQVVINRYESGRFGNSIKRVAYAKHQFAVGRKYNKENMRAVEKAIKEMPYPYDMVYFCKGHHFYGEFYCKIGAHCFFVEG